MNKNGRNNILTCLTIVVLLLTIAGFVWAAATQSNQLEIVRVESSEMKKTVDIHDTAITTITTKLDYIIKSIDKIERNISKIDSSK